MSVPRAHKHITQAALSWPDVEAGPHRFGGTEFRLGTREIGHVHSDGLVDIPFPTRVRDEVVAAGAAAPHHVRPASGWVSCYLRTSEDVERAIVLLRRTSAARLSRTLAAKLPER